MITKTKTACTLCNSQDTMYIGDVKDSKMHICNTCDRQFTTPKE